MGGRITHFLSKGGTASGSCASSFGVCCVFSLRCGTTNYQNNTYLEQATYTVGTDADPCTYTICAFTSDVTKIKIEFSTMVLQGPYGTSTVVTPAVAMVTAPADDYQYSTIDSLDSALTGDCMYDQLTVVSPGHASPPTVCGYNTGQHMFVPMSDKCVTINIDIDTALATATSRTWSMKITQYDHRSLMAPVANCLQYLTANTGTIANFNYDTSVNDASTGVLLQTQYHLSSQSYDICIRRKQGYCSMCFSPYISIVPATPATPPADPPATGDASSYGMGSSSVSAIETVSTSSEDTCTDMAGCCSGFTNMDTSIATGGGSISRGAGDYLGIVSATDNTGTSATTSSVYRLCGNLFNSDGTAVAQATVCTFHTPFKVGVNFDHHEALATTNPGTILNQIENGVATGTVGAGHGYSGFYLSYWQNTC